MPNLLVLGSGTEFRSEKILQGQVPRKYYTKEKILLPEAEFLDEIQTKVLRVFLLAIHSYTVKEKRGKPDIKPYPFSMA